MSYLHNKSWYFALGVLLAVLSGIMLFGFTQVARADERGFRHHAFMDSHYGHNRSYPSRGQFIEALPSGHRMAYYGDARYYFHGGIWYRPQGSRFVIVLFIYPRQGQSEQKQATDRYECHRWAVSQTGHDPIQPPAGVPAAQMSQKRADYQRAIGACLDGRGYTVK
ncbi:MAG: hypothetical protein NTW12_11340 [Deltaproteobacteria bacterium]|nr:hypothetical protein [Deltaproteobacteria bacterium]